MTKVSLVDLHAQRRRLGDRIDKAIAVVLEHGKFIMGPEVFELEERLAEFSGARHAVTCSSGTDALVLALLARDVGPGDAVIVPSFTFAATAEAVALLRATPVFADSLPGTYNIDAGSAAEAVAEAMTSGLRPVGVVAVDLFGQPAAYDRLDEVAREHGLWILADAAQSFGATSSGCRTGQLGDIAATSFFPAKPLGCYGDGGAVFTDDDEVAARLRSLRAHGSGTNKYDNVRVGVNGRLDTIQAAVLLQKLEIFEDELAARQGVADRYSTALSGVVGIPRIVPGTSSAWAQYTITLADRDEVAAKVREDGVQTAVYYPVPSHRQPAYQGFPVAADPLPVSECLAASVLSLPMHPYLKEADQDAVIDAVAGAIASDG